MKLKLFQWISQLITLTNLCHIFAKHLIKKKESGRILNTASLAAFQPCPKFASYAATKSYVLSFSQALNYELKPYDITVTALCPGFAETEFIRTAGQNASLYTRLVLMKSHVVANIGIKAMFKGKQFVVPGILNKLHVAFLRTVPRSLLTSLAGKFL